MTDNTQYWIISILVNAGPNDVGKKIETAFIILSYSFTFMFKIFLYVQSA